MDEKFKTHNHYTSRQVIYTCIIIYMYMYCMCVCHCMYSTCVYVIVCSNPIVHVAIWAQYMCICAD